MISQPICLHLLCVGRIALTLSRVGRREPVGDGQDNPKHRGKTNGT